MPTVDAAAMLREHVYDEAAPPSRNARIISMPICESCGENWRGSAETGGCTARLLARRVALLEGLLREAQWVPLRISYPTTHEAFRTCPVCGVWWLDEGEKRHLADCRLAAALADGG